MYIEAFAISDKGEVRDKNEDMILLDGKFVRDAELSKEVILNKKGRFIAAVADGMGGHRRGDVASEEVSKALSKYFYNMPSGLDSDEVIDAFKNWIQQEHSNIVSQGQESAYLKDMGTTLVALIVYEGRLFWMNCGDSRIYRLRNNILCQLSTDHSLRQMAGDADAPSNVIINSIGAGSSVFLDIVDITETVYEQDAFLLCSDGLTDVLEDDEIEMMLLNSPLNKLIGYAIASGAGDNVSVCYVKFAELN